MMKKDQLMGAIAASDPVAHSKLLNLQEKLGCTDDELREWYFGFYKKQNFFDDDARITFSLEAFERWVEIHQMEKRRKEAIPRKADLRAANILIQEVSKNPSQFL